MGKSNKLNKLITTHRGPGEVQDWLFSLTPVGVAFVFYIVFIVSSNIGPKGLFIAFGAAAGFIGLESYWIIRGWRKHHLLTILLGFVGIALTMGLLGIYLSLAG